MSRNQCSLLHLADFHFGADPKMTAEIAAQFLIDDVRQACARPEPEARSGPQPVLPDVCVVAGDLVAQGRDYEEAEQFLRIICQELFKGNPEHVLIVPGNHDVDWSISKLCYQEIPYSEDLEKSADEPGTGLRSHRVRDRVVFYQRQDPIYKSRLGGFEEFYRRFYDGGRTVPNGGPRGFVMVPVPGNPEVVLVGFSSCEGVDHLNNVPEVDINGILGAHRRIESHSDLKEAIRVAVWHHGLRPDGRRLDYLDPSVVEILGLRGGFSLLLHGHLHQSEYESARSLTGRAIPVIGAGSLGAPSPERPESVPYQYNLITIEDGQVTVHSRRRRTHSEAWQPDYNWGGEGLAYVIVDLPRRSSAPRLQVSPRTAEGGRLGSGRYQKRGWPLALVMEQDWESVSAADPEVRSRATEVVRSGGRVGLEHPEFLFGRLEDLAFVLERVLERENRCISGPHWVGKSAFLQALCHPEVQRRVGDLAGLNEELDRTLWIYLDLRPFAGREPAEQVITSAMANALGVPRGGDCLAVVAERLSRENRRLVAVLDHFDDLLEKGQVESAFLNRLRAHALDVGVVYAMTSEARVATVGRDKAYYFDAIATHLGYFDSDQVSRAFLEVPLRFSGTEVSDRSLDRLIALGGRHPFFLSLVRRAFLDDTLRFRGEPEEKILDLAESHFTGEAPRLYDGLLARLKPAHHRVLASILERPETYDGTISTDLDTFILRPEGGRPFSEHFGNYYTVYYLPLHFPNGVSNGFHTGESPTSQA